MRRLVRSLGLAVLAAVAAAAAWHFGQRWAETPLPVGDEARIVDIRPGASLIASAEGMAEQGVLAHPLVFTWYARLKGEGRSIKAGEYRIEPGTTPPELLDQLVSGRVLLHALTVVEGWTFDQMLVAIRAHPALEQTVRDKSPAEIMAELGEPDRHPEGLFLPETYRFPRGTTDLTVLRQARDLMNERLNGAWQERAQGLPFETPYEALTLASIVEKETALDDERALIAGVFVRRLQRNMRLQTDPSVIYGIGENFDGNIRRRDLKLDTPYNTYTRAGLPPTPIALPGAASIEAVMHPAAGDALYFVATGEEDGGHYFSSTLKEHNEAVRRFLAKRRRHDGG